MFCGERGGYVNHKWWRRSVWLPAIRAAELDGLRVHDLRHLNASWRIWWGEPITKVAQELGHSSAAFTLRQYAHALELSRTLERETVLEKVRIAHSGGRPSHRPPRVIVGTQVKEGRP